jgi:hypothetical protein
MGGNSAISNKNTRGGGPCVNAGCAIFIMEGGTI